MSTELDPITRGDDRTVTITVNDTDGEPYAWGGAKLWFTAKLRVSDSDDDAVILKTSESGEGITFPEDGVALVAIDAADTAALPNKETSLFYDVQLRTASGKIHTVDSGRLPVTREITRA